MSIRYQIRARFYLENLKFKTKVVIVIVIRSILNIVILTDSGLNRP